MGGHIDALRRLGGGHLLLVQRTPLLPQIAQVRLEPLHALLALERVAVAGNDVHEVDRFQLLERVGPLVDVAIDQVGDVMHQQIARAQHLLFGQVDDDVATGVAVTEVQQADLAVAAEEGHVIDQRHRRRRHLQIVQAAGERGLHTDLLIEPRLRRCVSFCRRARLHAVELRRQALQQIREHSFLEDVAGQLPPGELVADDVHAWRERLIAARMVVVKMCVDQEAHRLVGDRLQLLQHRAS